MSRSVASSFWVKVKVRMSPQPKSSGSWKSDSTCPVRAQVEDESWTGRKPTRSAWASAMQASYADATAARARMRRIDAPSRHVPAEPVISTFWAGH